MAVKIIEAIRAKGLGLLRRTSMFLLGWYKAGYPIPLGIWNPSRNCNFSSLLGLKVTEIRSLEDTGLQLGKQCVFWGLHLTKSSELRGSQRPDGLQEYEGSLCNLGC